METRDGNKRKIGKPENKRGRNRENKTKTKYRSTKYRKMPEGAECQRQACGRNFKENNEKTY